MGNKILGIAGLIVFIAVGFGLLAMGWRDIDITCSRPAPGGNPSCHAVEKSVLGLVFNNAKAEDVLSVGYRTSYSTRIPSGMTKMLSLAFETKSGPVPLTAINSTERTSEKQKIIGQVHGFLSSPEETSFNLHIEIRGTSGYIGAGLIVFFLANFILVAVRKISAAAAR